jgi:glutamine phosphoribosylpyrophosphate amidotransferase
VKSEQLAHELWHYKYDTDRKVRARLGIKLAAVLWRFLREHEHHIAEAAGISHFDAVTSVPGTKQRDGAHPLDLIVSKVIGQTRDRYGQLLELGPNGTAEGRAVLADRYRAARAFRQEANVLVIDDTWTTGGRAQSAALALREAGAAKVAVVIVGRHFDRSFGTCESYYQQARRRAFTWDRCCLESSARR